MSNNSNHIDNWLIQSAALGNITVDNADWIAMQKLLEEKRKKRVFFFWLFAGIIAIALGLLVYYFMHQKNDTAKQNTIVNPTAATKNNDNGKAVTIDSNTLTENRKTDTAISSTQNNIHQSNNSLTPHNNNTTTTIQVPHNNQTSTQLHSPIKAVNKIATTPNATQNITVPANASQTTIAKNTTAPTTTANAATQMLNTIDDINNGSKKYTPTIVYMHNRYIDSLVNKKDSNIAIAKIDTTKKLLPKVDTSKATAKKKNNTTPLKSFAQINVGYAAMNIGTSLQTGILQLQYSFNVAKNLFIDIGAKAFAYNNNNKQKYTNVYRIVPPVPGTAFTEVDYKETQYSIANGFVAEPGVGFHYKIKKIELGAAWHYGMILNAANITTSVYDTGTYYNPLPASIHLTGEYDANNFIGKRYSTVSLHCTYQLTKKFIADAGYAYLYWYNIIDGVADNNTKRNSFYFTIGYRF